MIRNKDLGITENDIKTCDCRETLIYWKNDLVKQSASVKSKIASMKINHKNGLDVNYGDFTNTKGYLRVLGLMSNEVAARLSVLKRQSKERNIKTSNNRNERLIKLIMALDPALFQRAEEILNKSI